MLIAVGTQDNNEALNFVVNVRRAEGLLVTPTPRHTFRRPKNNPGQRRYVRVSVLEDAEGRTVLASAITSAVVVNKPECSWGDEELGETLNLVVDKASQGSNGGEEEDLPLNQNIVLAIEAWSSKTKAGEDDVLLGRGQTLVGYTELLEAEEPKARWVALSLGGNKSGKVEISVSRSANTKTSGDTRQLEEGDQEVDLEKDVQKKGRGGGRGDREGGGGERERKNDKGGRTGSMSSRNSDREKSRRGVDDGRELSDNSEGRSEDDTDRKRSIVAKASREVPDDSSSKARGTKWGLPSMPDLKSTLNASLTRATNLIAKQPEASTNNGGEVESDDGGSKEGSIGQDVAEEDNERQSVIGDEADRQATGKTSFLGNTSSHGMSGMLGARHGMISLKESLQARLTRTGGKLRLEHESGQGQDERAGEQNSEDEGARRDSGQSRAAVNDDNTPVLSYSSLTPDQGQGASATTLPARQAVDTKVKNAGLGNIFSDADDLQSSEIGTQDRQPLSRENSRRKTLDAQERKTLSRESSRKGSLDTQENKPLSRESSQRGSLGEGGRRAERRESISRAENLSPLRSLLQDVSADQGVSDSEDELHDNSEEQQQEQDEDAEDGEGEGDHEHVEKNEQSPASAGHAKWSPATHGLTIPDVASSVKEAAALVKSSLSSPKIAESLKSFRWNRNKEDGFSNNNEPPAQPASADDSADDVSPSITPTDAHYTEKTETFDEEEGSLGIDSSASPALPATLVLVTIFRASGLPEILPKRKFGRTKKDVTQDPYVLLKLQDCEAKTSIGRKEGQECAWGNGSEGEVVEMPIPMKKISGAGGFESSKLIFEVRNKSTDVREKDALLSSTEMPLSDWLGKKATWADLEATKGSPGGRVKLSIALMEGGAISNTSRRGSQKDNMGGDNTNTSATTESVAQENDDIGAASISSTNMKSDVHGAFQDIEQDTMGEHGDMAVIVERDPEADSINTPRASSEIGLGDHRESKMDAPLQNLESLPSEDSQNGSDREEGGRNATPQGLDELPKAGDEVVAPEGGAANAAGAISSDDIGPKHALPLSTAVEEVANSSGGVASTLADENVNITVLVQQADSLAISVSKNAFGRPKKNATQDPYVVLRICGSREATSAVAEGGSKCRWPGTAGEAVSLAVSSADLIAAGWGQGQAEGPHVTVEVWNQESANRQGDIFIGSAEVRLKDLLDDSGPTWVDLRRRRSNRGRVMIDVSCPILQQSVSDATKHVDVRGKRLSVDEKLADIPERSEDTHRTSDSELLEGGRVEAQENRLGDTETNEEQGDISNCEKQLKVHEPVHRSIQVASDGHDADDRPVQGEDNKHLSGADVNAVGQETVVDSSPTGSVAPVDSPEALAPPRKERQMTTPNAQKAGGDDVEEKPNVSTADVSDSPPAVDDQSSRPSPELENGNIVKGDTAGSADSRVVANSEYGRPSPEIEKRATDGDVHELSRRLVGGTATALDLAGSAPTSGAIAPPSTEKESTNVGSLTTTVGPVRQRPKQESAEFSQPGSENVSQSTRSGGDEYDRDARTLEQDQTSRSQLKSSDELHSDVASSINIGKIGSAHEDIQASKTATSHDTTIPTQPRDINQDNAFLTQQKLAKKWKVAALNHSNANVVAQAQTEKRLVRAREIARRRRQIISGCEPVGRRGRVNPRLGAQAIDSLAGADSSAAVTPEQARAATAIQGAFRGRAGRRTLRAHQRAAIKIQAAYRGYVIRREFTGLRARTRRANVEERRARQRRSRMAAMQQVCVSALFSVRSSHCALQFTPLASIGSVLQELFVVNPVRCSNMIAYAICVMLRH